jgi:hypothetical protein
LHYIDAGSFNLLASGIVNETSPGFLVIATTETEWIARDSPHVFNVREIDDRNHGFAHLSITNLDEIELCYVLASTICPVDTDNVRAISSLLHHQSAGDPVAVVEVVCRLCKRKLLPLDPTSEFWSLEASEALNLLAC